METPIAVWRTVHCYLLGHQEAKTQPHDGHLFFLDGSKKFMSWFSDVSVIPEIKKDYFLVVPIKYILVLATYVFLFHYKKNLDSITVYQKSIHLLFI